jgi:hypothetical protein
MKILILAITILLSSNIAFSAQVLDEGEKAPHKGVLFTMEEEKELRKTKEKVVKLEDLTVRQEDLIKIQDQRIDNYKRYAEENRPLTGWEKIMWFSLGVIATSASMYGAAKLIQATK